MRNPLFSISQWITLLALILLLPACSSTKPTRKFPPLQTSIDIRNEQIALIPILQPIKGEWHDPHKGDAAGQLALACMMNPLICPIALPILAPVALIIEEGKTTPEKEVENFEKSLNDAIESHEIQTELTSKLIEVTKQQYGDSVSPFPVLEHLPSDIAVGEPFSSSNTDSFSNTNTNTVKNRDEQIERISAEGLNYILETGITQIRLRRKKTPFILTIYASMRLIDVNTGENIIERTFGHSGVLQELNKTAISRNISETVDELSVAIADILYENVDLPRPPLQINGVGDFGFCCWICPEYPQKTLHGYRDIDTTTPNFRWKEFPQSVYRKTVESAFEQKISKTYYNLRIWDAENGQRKSLIYERKNLMEPSHHIERPLDFDSNYYWSVQSCFTLESGYKACTPWSYSANPYYPGRNVCMSGILPESHLFKFHTPSVIEAENAKRTQQTYGTLKPGDIVLIELFYSQWIENEYIVNITSINDNVIVGYFEHNDSGKSTPGFFNRTKIKKITLLNK